MKISEKINSRNVICKLGDINPGEFKIGRKSNQGEYNVYPLHYENKYIHISLTKETILGLNRYSDVEVGTRLPVNTKALYKFLLGMDNEVKKWAKGKGKKYTGINSIHPSEEYGKYEFEIILKFDSDGYALFEVYDSKKDIIPEFKLEDLEEFIKPGETSINVILQISRIVEPKKKGSIYIQYKPYQILIRNKRTESKKQSCFAEEPTIIGGDTLKEMNKPSISTLETEAKKKKEDTIKPVKNKKIEVKEGDTLKEMNKPSISTPNTEVKKKKEDTIKPVKNKKIEVKGNDNEKTPKKPEKPNKSESMDDIDEMLKNIRF